MWIKSLILLIQNTFFHPVDATNSQVPTHIITPILHFVVHVNAYYTFLFYIFYMMFFCRNSRIQSNSKKYTYVCLGHCVQKQGFKRYTYNTLCIVYVVWIYVFMFPRSSSPLSQLYGTQATLEHHHFNHAVIILNSEVRAQNIQSVEM